MTANWAEETFWVMRMSKTELQLHTTNLLKNHTLTVGNFVLCKFYLSVSGKKRERDLLSTKFKVYHISFNYKHKIV